MSVSLILTQDVPNLGSLGDEIIVKNGFARNYLLPRGMAISTETRSAADLKHHRAMLDKLRKDSVDRASEMAEKVKALDIVLYAKVGKGDRLYGSITNRDIQSWFEEQGHQLERKSIVLNSAIRNLGNHSILVRLHTDVKIELTVRVQAIQDEKAASEQEAEHQEVLPEESTQQHSETSDAPVVETQIDDIKPEQPTN